MQSKIKQCNKCGEFKNIRVDRNECYKCSYKSDKYRFNPNDKGVKEYQLIINYFLTLDRIRGKTYGQLAKQYKLDPSNIRKRVLGILNSKYYKSPHGETGNHV